MSKNPKCSGKWSQIYWRNEHFQLGSGFAVKEIFVLSLV